MPNRVRRASQRAFGLAFLVLLALAVIGPTTVVAEGPVFLAPRDRPIARQQEPKDTPGYRLPFAPGLDVPIHQGWNSGFSHNDRAAYAYDFGLPEGTPVLAAAGGVVSWAHDGELKCGGEELRRKTNYVTIDHPDGSATHYGHLLSVGVGVGDVVKAGQQIGRAGKSGYSGCMAHLHFARQEQGAPVTQSMPVYFDAYPGMELRDDTVVQATAPACAPTDKVAPLEAFCATYSPLAPIVAPAKDGSAPAKDGSNPAAGGSTSAAVGSARTTVGPAYFSRLETAIDFDWAEKAPGGYWLDEPIDGFAARWSGRFTFATGGTYQLHVFASDRVRVIIDGVTVLNQWSDHPDPQSLTATVKLQAGVRRIYVEHVDGSGRGSLRLEWSLEVLENSRWSRFGPLV